MFARQRLYFVPPHHVPGMPQAGCRYFALAADDLGQRQHHRDIFELIRSQRLACEWLEHFDSTKDLVLRSLFADTVTNSFNDGSSGCIAERLVVHAFKTRERARN